MFSLVILTLEESTGDDIVHVGVTNTVDRMHTYNNNSYCLEEVVTTPLRF